MENKDKEKEFEELGEDTTKYGEIVSTRFGWIAPSIQKKRAEELENLGKKKNNKKSKE